MGRLPRLPRAIYERTGVAVHQSLARESPRLMRLGDRPPAARVRYRPRTPYINRFPRGTPQISPLRRTARGPQIVRRWWLGMGVQHDCHHPPGREDGHGRHARRGCSPARFGATLQALYQTPRPWRHAEVFVIGVDAIRAQQLHQQSPPRATLLKTTFRLLLNDSKCRRSPDTKRFAVEVGSSR